MINFKPSPDRAVSLLDASRRGFEEMVKKEVLEGLVKEYTEAFEKEVRARVKKELGRLVIKQIHTWQDMEHFEKSLNIKISWLDENDNG